MNFCEKCNTLCTDSICPDCGSKDLRAPEANDFCFLTERAPMWADMLRAALSDVGIESAFRPLLGMGTTFGAGRTLDRHQIYVPYDRFTEAQDVMFAIFGETNRDRSPSSIWHR